MFIASCPECGDSLTFPSGVALSSKCRCPLCTETFTLEECLSELPPMAEVLEGGETGSGLAPAYGGGVGLATAPRAATASRAGTKTAAGPRTASRAPARKAKGGNPILQFAQIVVGGAVGVTLALLIIWWGLGRDPFGLGPTVAQYAAFLVPENLRGASALDNPEAPATTNGEAPGPRNSRRSQQGVQLDGSRFRTDEEEQSQTPNRRAPRTSLDPDAGELEPVVESGEDLFAPSGAFSSPLEEPSLENFALPGIEAAPQEPTADPSVDVAPNEPTIDVTPLAPTLEPTLSEPPLDEPMEEEGAEPGAFQLKPLVDPTDESLTADPTAPTDGPFSLVFPTATEDLPSVAAAEAQAWDSYVATSDQSPSARKKPAEDHYEQLATVAQTLAGLPPSPRTSAVVAETTQKLADRFDEESEQRVANFLARQRLTNVDFDMAGVVVVGRVTEVKPEGELAVVTLSLEHVRDDAARRVVTLVRESQGVPAEDSLVVAMGVKHPSDTSTLPASLAEEKAPIVLAGAVAEIGATEAPATEEQPATEPAPSEPVPGDSAPEPTTEPEPAPVDPTPAEPSSEEPAPAAPAPTEEPATDPAPEEPAPEEPSTEEPAPTEEAPAEEPAPAEVEETP